MDDERRVALPETAQEQVTYNDGALKEMQDLVNFHMAQLNTRQQRFVQRFAEGYSPDDAAGLAGYIGRNRRTRALALVRDNEHARALLQLLREIDGIKYGYPAEWKRAELTSLYRGAKGDGQYSAANSVLKTMMTLDGDIAPGGGVTVNMNPETVEVKDVSARDLSVVSKIRMALASAEEAEIIDVCSDK